MLEPGDDLRALAPGGGGGAAPMRWGWPVATAHRPSSAAVAAAHGLPFVCIPAGTVNDLALDLGVDRQDPVRALDAFGPAKEGSIDLAEVNGEAFVNNVSLGLYARFVGSETYREAKRRTVAEMLPELLGPGAPPSGLSVDRDGEPIPDLQVILVSNNPYTLSSLAGFGSRARLDTGALGVASLVHQPHDRRQPPGALEAAGHPERFEGWRQWTTQTLEVHTPPVMPPAAVDGEARPPGIRRFGSPSGPAALCVRIAVQRARRIAGVWLSHRSPLVRGSSIWFASWPAGPVRGRSLCPARADGGAERRCSLPCPSAVETTVDGEASVVQRRQHARGREEVEEVRKLGACGAPSSPCIERVVGSAVTVIVQQGRRRARHATRCGWRARTWRGRRPGRPR